MEPGKRMKAVGRVPLRTGLTLYLLGEESVLFSKRSLQLYGLDRIATLALLRLEEGEEPGAVSRDLGLDAASCEVVSQLSALLAGHGPSGDEYESHLPCPLKAPDHPPGLPLCRLLDTAFAIEGPEELLREWVTPFVAHLRTQFLTGIDTQTDLLISIEAAGSAWRLVLNGAPQGDAVSAEGLLPLLFGRLRSFAYQNRPYLLAVHGAVVSAGGCTPLLAGQSGSGKSTLAAVLIARGYELVSDEPAVIDRLGNRVLPMPLGLGLKAGSWSALRADYPELERLRTHFRFDGQPIRYLLPQNAGFGSNGAEYRATHLVFPTYGRGVAAKIEPLGPVHCLRAIARAGYQVPALDEQRVEQILGWLGSVASFSLTYSSTRDALALLQRVLNDE